MSSNYQPISCEVHSLIELAIMRNTPINVILDNTKQLIKPVDVFAKEGREYLSFVDQNNSTRQMRADKITYLDL